MNRIAAYLNVTKPRIARTSVQVEREVSPRSEAPAAPVSKAIKVKSERMLKDIAFVLQLTRRIRDEIENS